MKKNKDTKNQKGPIVGIMGPFGFGNLGDAAIQEAMLQNLSQRFPQATIFGFSLNPVDTEKRHHIKSYPVGRMASYGWAGREIPENRFERIHLRVNQMRDASNNTILKLARIFLGIPLEIYSALVASSWLKGMNAFIVSGGGQLDEYWGGPMYHPYTLFLWAVLAKLRGVKFKVVSVGKGSLDSALSRWFVRQALRLSSYRSYRDRETQAFVNQIGFQNSDPVYTDLAFSLITNIRSNHRQTNFRGTIGIGPMAYFDPRVWPEKDSQVYENYLYKLVLIAKWLFEHNFAIRLFPGESAHDHDVIQDYLALLEQSGIETQPGQVIYDPVDSVEGLMEQLGCTDAVIGCRFHGVLLSLLIQKPVVALAYHSKVVRLMEEMDQEMYCFPIDHFEVIPVIERFEEMWENRQEIQDHLGEVAQAYRARLDEQYEVIFADI